MAIRLPTAAQGVAARTSAARLPRPMTVAALKDYPVEGLLAKAQVLARGVLSKPEIQRIEFQNSTGPKPTMLVYFHDTDGTGVYGVRLAATGNKTFETKQPHADLARGLGLMTRPNLSSVRFPVDEALKLAKGLASKAVWNNASIMPKGQGSGWEYHFWNTTDLKQPVGIVDAQSGKVKLEHAR